MYWIYIVLSIFYHFNIVKVSEPGAGTVLSFGKDFIEFKILK